MTTILPSARSPFEAIMEQVGSGLSKTLPDAVKDYGTRQRSMQSIDDLQKSIADARNPETGVVDITKVLPAIAKTYANNPSFERSGLADQFIAGAQRSTMKKDFPAGQGKGDSGPTRTNEQGKQVPVSASDLVPPRETSIVNPQGITDFQLPYGPEQFAEAKQKSRELGYLPEQEKRVIDDMQQFNQVAEQKRTHDIANYNQQQQQLRDTLENQKRFGTYMKDNAPEMWENPDDREMSLKASERILNDPKNKNTSYADLLSKVKKEIRPYQAAREALKTTLKRPLFGQTKDQRAIARPRAQMMVDAGQKPQLQLMIAQGGSGEVEEADLLNPLPAKFEESLNKFNNFYDPQSSVTTIDPDSPKYHEQLREGMQKLDRQENYITDFLADNITSGSYDKPGTNLLLTRYHIMEKGGSWEKAANIIDKAIAKGKIQLDPQQKIDYQKLAYPPLTGDSYFDTVMNNIMFPITGKQ